MKQWKIVLPVAIASAVGASYLGASLAQPPRDRPFPPPMHAGHPDGDWGDSHSPDPSRRGPPGPHHGPQHGMHGPHDGHRMPPPPPPPPPASDRLLRALDSNGNDTIDGAELEQAIESIRKLDSNGDGQLTRDEFLPPPPPGGPHDRPGHGPGRGPGHDAPHRAPCAPPTSQSAPPHAADPSSPEPPPAPSPESSNS